MELVSFVPVDNPRLANLCGVLDENLRQMETALDVSIARRGEVFQVDGEKARLAVRLLQDFYQRARNALDIDEIQLALVEAAHKSNPEQQESDIPVLMTRRTGLHGRTERQNKYIRQMMEFDITFGIGPAGTGKTYLAVAGAVDALERDLVKRIVLVRPAVEAGERLGFLPGDLVQKVDPYLRPLYDALYDLMGFDKATRAFERQIIEIAPLGVHARPHVESRVHHPGRGAEHHAGTDEDVPDPHRLRFPRGGHRRRHPDRSATRSEMRPDRGARGVEGSARHRLHRIPE
jgi:phosphate starvation-inducible PhoH-like protein